MIFTFSLIVTNAFCLTIPATEKGSLAFVVPSFTSQPSGYSTYFLVSNDIGGRTFSYSKRVSSGGGVFHDLTFSTNGKYNVYSVADYDNLQDIITVVYTLDSVKVYVDGVKLGCSKCDVAVTDIDGSVTLWSDNVVNGTFTYFSQVLTDSQVANGVQTYLSYGNFGVNSIDIIFNALFKLLKRIQ